jgi:cyclopropane fatty-acyl-phospholipid synthase-like methyltransferase
MTEDNYWIKFWQTDQIVHKPTPHEKVGRTIGGVPISDAQWKNVLDDLERYLELKPHDRLLDIGAGSGVISIPFSETAAHVTALDLSATLLEEMKGRENISTVVANALEVHFERECFDKIVIYFAIQHFTEQQTLVLLEKAFQWLKPGGILYIGDIPDASRKFRFFNTPERQAAYFSSVKRQEPIIGTWFDKEFFLNLAAYLGFSSATIIEQPEAFMNAHYRFDSKFVKS